MTTPTLSRNIVISVVLALAAAVALAGILNLRPVEGSLEPEA